MMNRKSVVLGVASLGLATAVGYALRAAAAGIPATNALTYAGVLEDATGPVTGTHNVQVILYDAATAGNLLCQSTTAPLGVVNGHFSVQLPDTCTTAVGANANAWADVLVDGSDTGRTKLGAVPYAVEANHAVSATSANSATSATTAATANAAGGSLATTVSSLQSGLSSLQGSSLGFSGAGPGIIGPAAPSSGYTVQAGSNVFTSDASGDGTIDFPTPFPHGIVSIVLTNGDACCGGAGMWLLEGATTSSFPVRTSTPNQQQRVNWVALGW